jgi:sarcosine oxidase subunit delta
MKILNCPVNGPRPVQEFHFGGEVRHMPEPAQCDDVQWADYVFNRSGEPGVKREWWFHIASSVWFIAERNIVTDNILRTYLFDPANQPQGHPQAGVIE